MSTGPIGGYRVTDERLAEELRALKRDGRRIEIEPEYLGDLVEDLLVTRVLVANLLRKLDLVEVVHVGRGTVPCKGCKKPIVFGKTRDGKTIPLDPRAPVYRVRENDPGEFTAERFNEDIEGQCWYFVTHYSTCSHANEFGKSKRASA